MSNNHWKFYLCFINLILFKILNYFFHLVEKLSGQPRMDGTISILASVLIKNNGKNISLIKEQLLSKCLMIPETSQEMKRSIECLDLYLYLYLSKKGGMGLHCFSIKLYLIYLIFRRLKNMNS